MDTKYIAAARAIRAEMVCCDIYTVMTGIYKSRGIAAFREMKRSGDYHAICYYGEMAAQYVEECGREDWRKLHEPL